MFQTLQLLLTRCLDAAQLRALCAAKVRRELSVALTHSLLAVAVCVGGRRRRSRAFDCKRHGDWQLLNPGLLFEECERLR